MLIFDHLRMLFDGAPSTWAVLKLLLHMLWTRRLFDGAFFTMLCRFVAASRALADKEDPHHCYLHEVMNALWAAMQPRDHRAFIAQLDRVTDYLYRRGALTFVGLAWFWEGSDTTSCAGHVQRMVEQGYVLFDGRARRFQHDKMYMRYQLTL